MDFFRGIPLRLQTILKEQEEMEVTEGLALLSPIVKCGDPVRPDENVSRLA